MVDKVCFGIEKRASMTSSSFAHFSATGTRAGRICSTTGIKGCARVGFGDPCWVVA